MNSTAITDADGSSPRRNRGRPRAAEVDKRILRTALLVFAAEGWRGFYLEAVAKAAGVGKSTIYLRWSTREELIVDAFDAHGYQWVDADSGDIREDLRALALGYGRFMDSTDGPLGLRLFIEAYMNPEFAAVSATMRQTAVSDAHRIIRRAKRRGQLRPDVSAAVILDALFGGMMHHMSTAPPPASGGLYYSPAGIAFVSRLVDMLLDGQLNESRS